MELSKKEQILNEWRNSIISAINLSLDKVKDRLELENTSDSPNKQHIENYNLSIQRYNNLKAKIVFNEELTSADYNLISIICTFAAHYMSSYVQEYIKGIEQLQNLAKIFMA